MRKICKLLHLWLGLASGIVVFIVCITGCLYVFKDELIAATEPWRKVEARNTPFKTPSQILHVSNQVAADSIPSAITYGERTDAVWVDYFRQEKGQTTVFLDPYSAQVLHVSQKEKGEFEFFRWVLQGHRTLWLPREVGHWIVGYGVLVFFITLITGCVLWLPRRWNKKSVRHMLTLKRPFSLLKFNFDLHTVVAFYALLPLMTLCFTGLMFSLDWWSGGVYRLVSGGQAPIPYEMPLSDSLQHAPILKNPLDRLYKKISEKEKKAVQFYYALPQTKDGIYRVSVVHERGSYYKTDNLFFDQYTLHPLQGKGAYAGRYAQASAADKLMRMNLEIHDGRVLGVMGKILMCLASLVGASLPVTGFIIWYRRIQRSKRNKS